MTTTQRKKACNKHQPTGQWIRPEKRLAIYLRDAFHCCYCNRDLHDAAAHDITLDHLTPKSAGGSNDATNLVTACKTCNCARGNKTVAKFLSQQVESWWSTPREVRQSAKRSIKRMMVLAKSLINGDVKEA